MQGQSVIGFMIRSPDLVALDSILLLPEAQCYLIPDKHKHRPSRWLNFPFSSACVYLLIRIFCQHQEPFSVAFSRVIVPSMIQGLHNIGCVTGKNNSNHRLALTVLLCFMDTEFILAHLFCFLGIRLNIPSPILQQRHFNLYNFP